MGSHTLAVWHPLVPCWHSNTLARRDAWPFRTCPQRGKDHQSLLLGATLVLFLVFVYIDKIKYKYFILPVMQGS